MHLGPDSYDYDFAGFDNLLFVNLTGNALTLPELGVLENGADANFLKPLLQGGYATDPLFGGDGPVALDNLGGFSVFDTLIPDGGTAFDVAGDGLSALDVPLEDGQAAFLGGSSNPVPEPASLGLFATALALLGLAWKRRRM
ncbi:MAG: PEP-CTERM sorting domain-containing protein [Stellaceae bacterium]